MDVACDLLAEEQVLFEELHAQSGVSWTILASLLLGEAWTFMFPPTLITVEKQLLPMVYSGYDELLDATTIKKS